MTNFDQSFKSRLVEISKQAMRLGLMPLTQGNISVRDPESGYVTITPHDYSYEKLTVDDLVVVDLKGQVIEGSRAPSAEMSVHLVVYSHRPLVHGIVHAEPVYTNAFGVIHKEIEPVFVNMAIDVGGSVPVMPFGDSGNAQFGYDMLKVMENKNAVIWANHGVLTVGPTLEQALHCAYMVEMGAKIYSIALSHGKPIAIPEEKIATLIG